jgi:hypothetical protein
MEDDDMVDRVGGIVGIVLEDMRERVERDENRSCDLLSNYTGLLFTHTFYTTR